MGGGNSTAASHPTCLGSFLFPPCTTPDVALPTALIPQQLHLLLRTPTILAVAAARPKL